MNIPRWVDVLFGRLHVRYGDAWPRKWEGLRPDEVRADWYSQLASVFDRNPGAIKHALEHLPEYPPNADAFRRLCMMAPSAEQALPAPAVKADPDRLAAAMALLGATSADPAKQCADNLRARREREGRLGMAQKSQLMALEAMGK